MRILTLASVLSSIVLSARSAPADFDLDGDIYRNEQLGVQMAVPEGWILSRMTGYRSLLALLTRSDGARMSLSLTEFRRKQTLIQLMLDNQRALTTLGFTVSASKRAVRIGNRSWAVMEASTRDRKTRQFYLIRGRRVYILTYAAPSPLFGQHLADLDYVLESLKARQHGWRDEERIRDRGQRGGRAVTPGRRGAMEQIPEIAGKSDADTKSDIHTRARRKGTSRPASQPASQPSPSGAPRKGATSQPKAPSSRPESVPALPELQ